MPTNVQLKLLPPGKPVSDQLLVPITLVTLNTDDIESECRYLWSAYECMQQIKCGLVGCQGSVSQ